MCVCTRPGEEVVDDAMCTRTAAARTGQETTKPRSKPVACHSSLSRFSSNFSPFSERSTDRGEVIVLLPVASKCIYIIVYFG